MSHKNESYHTHMCRMEERPPCVSDDCDMSHMNLSRHIQMSHVSRAGVMGRGDLPFYEGGAHLMAYSESHAPSHTWTSHVMCNCNTPQHTATLEHLATSCNTRQIRSRVRHDTHEQVMSHIHTSRCRHIRRKTSVTSNKLSAEGMTLHQREISHSTRHVNI